MPAKNKPGQDPADRKPNKQQLAYLTYLVHEGLSQRQAFIKAGYKVNYADHLIDSNAWMLLQRPYMQKAYNQMVKERDEELRKKAVWTRDQSIEANLYMYNIGKEERDRIQRAYEEEYEEFMLELEDALTQGDAGRVQKIREKLRSIKRSRRIGMVPVASMRGAIDSLNKMHGYDTQSSMAIIANVTFGGDSELKD